MLKKLISLFFVLMLLFFVISCKDDVLPKPSSQLRLDYPVAKYAHFSNHCPFEFEMNEDAVIKEDKDCGFSIHYPKMKATIYLTYIRAINLCVLCVFVVRSTSSPAGLYLRIHFTH